MDKEGFARSVIEAERALYRTAKTILRNDEDCKDAVQSAVLIAYDKLYTLQREEYFKTWLVRITVNECYKLLRNRRDDAPLDDYAELIGIDHETYRSDIYTALENLSDKYRLPFVLFYVEGYSIREIAHILKLHTGSVKTRLHRARRMLKEKLAEDFFMEGAGYEQI